MSDLDENELDKAFRMGIEGQHIEPPPSVWKAVRSTALESQLIKYQTANLWLKGITGVLTVMLSGTTYLWYQAAKSPDVAPQVQVITQTKTDTVFVPRTDQVFMTTLPQPQVNKNEQQILDNQVVRANDAIAENPTSTQAEKEILTNLQESSTKETTLVKEQANTPKANEIAKEKTNQESEKITQESSVDNVATNSTVLSKEADKITNASSTKTNKRLNKTTSSDLVTKEPTGRQANRTLTAQQELAKSSQSAAWKSNNQQEKSAVNQPLLRDNSSIEYSNPNGSVSVDNQIIIGSDASQAEFKRLSIARLQALPYHFEIEASIPKIRYRTYQKPSVPIRLPKQGLSLLERISVSAFVAPEWNNLSVRRNEPRAFDYANQVIKAGNMIGLRLGVQLSERLSVVTGVEYSKFEVEEKDKKVLLKAENVNGKPCFVYRTALGTVQIPVQDLGYQPKYGDPLLLESGGFQNTTFWRIPVGVRYDFLNTRLKTENAKKAVGFTFYGLSSMNLTVPNQFNASVEIFVPNGKEVKKDLSNFENTQPSLGFQAALGAEMGFGRHFRILMEPAYFHSVTSIVKDMPITSLRSSFGLKFGAKWQFKSNR